MRIHSLILKMSGRIVIKLGGSLITDKATEKTLKKEVLDTVSKVIATIVNKGYSLVLVHGAGSFGHLLAKKWSIVEGADSQFIDRQRRAVIQIREDMRELNSGVSTSLALFGINSIGNPPSDWAVGTGKDFKGDLAFFERDPEEPVPITFGDAVDTLRDDEFGILSGDDLMLRLSIELPNVTHSIFLLGDSAGLMDRPPNQEDAQLLPSWNPNNKVASEHDSEIDVTGGIRLKINRASEIASEVDQVWLLDGREPSRMLELLETGRTIGTKILPG